MRTILQDLRYGLRAFSRNPKFSLLLILVLALGIGGTASIYTVVYGVLLQPLPYKNPEKLLLIRGEGTPPDGDAIAWWSQGEVFESLCNYRSGGVNFTDGESPTRINAAVISAGFFPVFGVTPIIGRPFATDDEKPGYNRIAILSDRMWDQYFNRDPSVIGRIISLNNIPHTVAGVMPPGFGYPGRTDIWAPRAIGDGGSLDLGDDVQANLSPSLRDSMVGRLREGITLEQAREQLQALFIRLKEISARHGISPGDGIRLIPLHEVFVRNFRQSLWLLLAAAGFLMLLSCANASTLMLSRAITRQKEMAVRRCLGAGTLNIVRQLLMESLLITIVSGILGILIAYWGVIILRLAGPGNIPRLADIRVDTHVLFFTLGISLFVGIAIGIMPAVQSMSSNLVNVMKEEGTRSVAGLRHWVRYTIVVVEVALALVLVVGASLSIQSFFGLTNISPGFNPKGVITLNITLPASKYRASMESKVAGQTSRDNSPSPDTDVQTRFFRIGDFHRRLLEKIESTSGVIAAGVTTQIPLSGARNPNLWVDVPGAEGTEASLLRVYGNYFQAMGIPVLRGRSLTLNDHENSPKVAVVNESFAKKYWEGKNPLGYTIVLDGEPVPREIVGIVGDVKQTGLIKDAMPQIYLSYFQPYLMRHPPLNMSLVIRTDVDLKLISNSIREQVLSVDQTIPIFQIRNMEDVIAESIVEYRFRGVLLGTFAALALIMAVIGVYGVVAHSTASRFHEIGVRMALGATPKSILHMILREGIILAFIGVALGSVTAIGLGRFLSSLLYGVSPTDPLTLIVSSVTLIVGVLLACALPALSASKVEPSTALRYE